MTYSSAVFSPQVGSSYGRVNTRLAFSRILWKDSVSTSKVSAKKTIAQQRFLDKLVKIERLENNWNGYGAEPLSKSLINESKKMIYSFAKIPQVFPTADGTLQFEYDKKDGSYLEFQLSTSEMIDVFEVDKNGVETEYQIIKTVSNINQVVRKFYEY